MAEQASTWEYWALDGDPPDLTTLGRQGWELVAVAGSGADRRLYLKRRAASFRERVTQEQRAAVFARLGLDPAGGDR